MVRQQRYNGLITIDPDDEDERNRGSILKIILRKFSSPLCTALSTITFIILVIALNREHKKVHASFSPATASKLAVASTTTAGTPSGDGGSNQRLLFFNAKPGDKGRLQALNEKDYPKGGACIATLVTNRTKDISELQTALLSLRFLQGDTNPSYPAPVLIFNEGDLAPDQVRALVESTNRPMAFPLVDFSSFPEGFDPSTQETAFRVKGRAEWGYYQMIRFWITALWRHPAIADFETIMRIDSDSCFKEPNAYLPNFFTDNLYYHSQYVGVEDGVQFLNGLFDFASNFMEQTRAPPEPRNYLLWDLTRKTWENENTLPLFRSNFEVSRKSFMQRPDVVRWHEALTEHEPFGVFRYRWGDAVTRFLMAAIFENMDRIFTVRPTGYFHKIGCEREEVEEALKNHFGSVM